MMDGHMLEIAPFPPANVEAEQALLGALLVNNAAFHRVSDTLRPEHFAEAVHGRIYEAVAKLIGQGSVANPVTLKNLFERDGALAEVGGAGYLVRLVASVVTIINAPDYAKTIRDCWQRRQLMSISAEAAEAAADFEADASETLERTESALMALHVPVSHGNGPRHLSEFGQQAIEAADRAYKRQGQITGITTGLADLDRQLGGLQPTDLVYLAARPSMGKTALATTIGRHAALAGHPTYLASMEMSGAQVALRSLGIQTGLSSLRIRTGELQPQDFDRLTEANAAAAKIPFVIDDRGGLTLSVLRTSVRRFLATCEKMAGVRAQEGEGVRPLVIVDYLQLMASTARRSENRNQDLSEISRGLKAMAKEFGVPMLVLSQLSRQVEQRDNKRPMLSDLRDSGSLEQDADVVMFLFREEYYLTRDEPAQRAGESQDAFGGRFVDWQAKLDAVRNLAELNIAKQRQGATGRVMLRFDPETTNFENLVRS